jgi:hypothetical protein
VRTIKSFTEAADEHQVVAGYGEDGYTWDCTCGQTDGVAYDDLDRATEAGAEHLIDEGAMPELVIS